MAFDPTAYGTFRYGYTVESATWRGANDSGGFGRITAWPAISGSAASNDMAIAGGRLGPVVSCIGTQHCSFALWGVRPGAAMVKAAGTNFDTSTATGLTVGGVILNQRGNTSVGAADSYMLTLGAANRGLLKLAGGSRKFKFTDNAAATTTPGAWFSAAPTPFLMRINSSGYRLLVGGYSSAFAASQTGGNCGNIVYWGTDNSSVAYSMLGWQSLHFWDGDTTSMSDSVMNTIMSAWVQDFNLTTPTTFICVAGHSWGAGAWSHGEETFSGLLQEACPAARVYNVSEYGALATNLPTQITNATAAAAGCGFTPSTKILIVFIGENEQLAASTTGFSAALDTAITQARNAGFRIVFMDTHPITNRSAVDATVAGYENTRAALRVILSSKAAGDVKVLTYTNRAPWKPTPAGSSDAQLAAANRITCTSRLYEVPLITGDDPTALTYSDGLHPGVQGIRSLVANAVAPIYDFAGFAINGSAGRNWRSR